MTKIDGNILVTGAAGFFADEIGVGAYHNQTWDYQVIYSDWDNRTVRFVWEETGPDSSSGEEYPERSPIQKEAEAPEVDEALGNLTVSRETGLMPIPMITGDELRLAGQEGLFLTVTAGPNKAVVSTQPFNKNNSINNFL